MSKKVILLLFFFVNISNVFSQIETLLENGRKKTNDHYFEGALQDYNQVLLIQHDNIEALLGRAEVRILTGNLNEALKDIEQVQSVNKSNPRSFVLYGEVLYNQKNYNEALKSFSQALQLNNYPSSAIIGKAKCLNQLGFIKESYKMLDASIQQEPNNPEFYYARGILNSTKEKYTKALSDLDKAQSLNPAFNPVGIAFNKGIALMNIDQHDNAIEQFTKAIELDSLNSTAFHSRGLSNYALENFKEAVADFTKSYEINPTNDKVLFNLGMAYNKINEPENACRAFQKSCKMGNINSCKQVILTCSDGKH